jgi:RNA polymerase sigma-70 factor, ECF subfamily
MVMRENVPLLEEAQSKVPTFASVYADYFDFVWRSLRHLGVPISAMDDAAQDVWLIVHRRLGAFEARSSVTTWLFGIVLNVARGRRRHTSQRQPPEPLPEELASHAPDPEGVLAGNQAWRLVQSFLDGLPEPGRAIFVSALLENFTPAETAEVVGVDVVTVYNKIRALRRAFQRRLSSGEEDRP